MLYMIYEGHDENQRSLMFHSRDEERLCHVRSDLNRVDWISYRQNNLHRLSHSYRKLQVVRDDE